MMMLKDDAECRLCHKERALYTVLLDVCGYCAKRYHLEGGFGELQFAGRGFIRWCDLCGQFRFNTLRLSMYVCSKCYSRVVDNEKEYRRLKNIARRVV